MSSPSAGKPTEHGFVGASIVTERKQAPTSVPPEQFTIGIRPPPQTCSSSQSYGPRFHGSPVVTTQRSDERSASGSPCGMSARTSVGETPSIVTRSSSTICHTRSCGRSGAPSMKTTVAPQRHRADHGPRSHDPAHVRREEHAITGAEVGLVGGLARDREEEAALDVQRALRLARSCPTCRRGGTAPRSRRRRPRAFPAVRRRRPPTTSRARRHRAVDAGPTPDEHALDARRVCERLVEYLLHRDGLPAPVRGVGGEDELRARVGESRRHRGAGEPGEDRYLHRPDVRAGMRRDRSLRRHRQERADGVALADAELAERFGEPADLAGELAQVSERRSPSSGTQTAASRSGVSRAQRWTHASATLSRAPTNQVVHSIPRVSSSTASQSCASGISRSATTARQKRSGSSIESR